MIMRVNYFHLFLSLTIISYLFLGTLAFVDNSRGWTIDIQRFASVGKLLGIAKRILLEVGPYAAKTELYV